MSENHDKVAKNIKPGWLKIKLHNNEGYADVAKVVEKHRLHTICDSGKCPNKAECWSRRTATFMILGDICTRSCRFCATKTGKPLPPDPGEPSQVADSIRIMGLKHAVITSVDRDDLPDGGASHWAAVITAIRAKNPDTTIEVLIPDFDAREELLDAVMAAGPDIVGHNIETVERLTPLVRSRARYDTSLQAIRYIASRGFVAKSGIMLGLGESESEILATFDDLADAGCSILTVGQYLQPTAKHLPVAEYVEPGKFAWYGDMARFRGFAYVASAPLVRSSYLAEEALKQLTTDAAGQGVGSLPTGPGRGEENGRREVN
jgi:lipoic acid synthetase